jgi:soluble epoxide hydrolase/lipid-phosphate phosphatase
VVRYGWRYQIGPWVRAGYRVVVPDMLGYGGTDKPLAVEEYSTKKLCADLSALLDIVGVSKAVSSRVPSGLFFPLSDISVVIT